MAQEDRVTIPLTDLHAMNAEVAEQLDAAWPAVSSSSAFIGDHYVECFEQEWAEYCGSRFAVGVGNGTDALRLTLQALGIGGGDKVIVPTNAFVATVEAIVLAGATPRFVDVHPETLLVTPSIVEAATTTRTAAIIVVHLYVHVADMDGMCRVADKAKLALVEDAAQAHGATWRGRKAGTFGQAGCFSFYPAKNLRAFGDAGAAVTDDSELAAPVRSLSDHGRVAGARTDHALIGTNSRLDALRAAVLSAKLPRLDGWIEARRRLFVPTAAREHSSSTARDGQGKSKCLSPQRRSSVSP